MDFSFVSNSKAKPFSGCHVCELVLALTLIAIGLGLQTHLFALLYLFKQVKQFRKTWLKVLEGKVYVNIYVISLQFGRNAAYTKVSSLLFFSLESILRKEVDLRNITYLPFFLLHG